MFLFSEQIFEAIVVSVDHARGVCSISPIIANTNSTIDDVPLPHFAGNGNYGIFVGVNPGTRVIAMFTSATTRDVTVIVGLVPKPNLYRDAFDISGYSDTPIGTVPYPEIKEGDLIFRGDLGAQLSLLNSGDVIATGVNGGGIYLKKNQNRTAVTLATEDFISITNGGRFISGPVRRIDASARNLFPPPDLTQTPLFADPDYAVKTIPYGFFYNSRPLRRSYSTRKRNPELSEYRVVINEFSTDYMFTGFDDEVSRATNSLGIYDDSETYKRNREQGNVLHLAEHELVEVVAGNLVDINGKVLDINYRPLNYGSNNKAPSTQLEINYDRARRISRRGVAAHLQVSTNTRSTDPSQSISNFVFDVDKEGLLKVNIPASTDTGNIPFVSNANYLGEDDSVEVEMLNPSYIEPIPVTLRDENGEIVFPGKDAQNYDRRRTGVRYSVGEESPYFPTGTDGSTGEVRVNTTKHHNMYAVAERLIANTIRVVNIPKRFVSRNGFPEGLAVGKPFEIPIPASLSKPEDTSEDFPSFMGTVAVEPGRPAIYSGGGDEGNGIGTLIAGKLYTDDLPYSNSFNSSISGDEVSAEIEGGGQGARPVGGKSVHANLEGSMEVSVGKDNWDQKSVVLDTAGSIIAWLGKDKNNRSMVMQTDGDFLLNIGGSYDGSEGGIMNKGRLDIRVNVTDKKFVSTKFAGGKEPDEGGNPKAESDYIISISEEGLVIAGMKSQAPMIFRNDGPILIESASGPVTLKGNEIRTVDPKGSIHVIKPPTRN